MKNQPAPFPSLTVAERTMLGYALGLAQEQIYSRGNEFTAEDQTALTVLRRLATEAQQPKTERRLLTPNEHSAAWHAIEGSAGEEGADPGTVLKAVLWALGIDAPDEYARPVAGEQQAEACGKCRTPFDPTDSRFDGHAQHGTTPYCRRCVDACHDTEIADHRCVICA